MLQYAMMTLPALCVLVWLLPFLADDVDMSECLFGQYVERRSFVCGPCS